MFIRCAFFCGRVKPGQQDAFDAQIETELKALWAAFPGAEEVRVLREVEGDRPDSRMELVIQMRFPTREAIDHALASDVRYKSKDASQPLFDAFDGYVFHTVFETTALV